MKLKSGAGGGDLNGFLDAGSHMHGELRFEDTFRIDGRLTGKVISEGDLVVATNGRVFADLETPSLVVEDGAFVEGACSMVAAGKAEVVAKPFAAVPLLKER